MGRTVVLLSGGLDSTTVAAMARAAGHDLYAISFDYGQRHRKELQSAVAVGEALGVRRHDIMSLPMASFAGSALTEDHVQVPDAPKDGTMGDAIPATYVPARNTVFIAFALGYAEVVGASEIHLGVNAMDYSGYPDCRPEYIDAYQKVADLATKQAVEGSGPRLVTPLIDKTKADIVRCAVDAEAPLHLTWSCYHGGEAACGRCESCTLRRKGFKEAGVEDPIETVHTG